MKTAQASKVAAFANGNALVHQVSFPPDVEASICEEAKECLSMQEAMKWFTSADDLLEIHRGGWRYTNKATGVEGDAIDRVAERMGLRRVDAARYILICQSGLQKELHDVLDVLLRMPQRA